MTRPLQSALALGTAFAAAATLSLTGCSQTKEAATGMGDAAKEAAGATGDAAKTAASDVGSMAKDAATATGDAAKTAATGAAQTALAPAVNPVLDLLNKGQGQINAGNLSGAAATLGGFKGLWDKAGPVIKPLAGDKFPAIESAANTVISTFAGGPPDKAAASAALSGLIGPLSGLVGK
jgi:hypothetical protein